MPNSYFQFKQFTIHQERSAMKVTTDGCLFGAWVAEKVKSMPRGKSGGLNSLDVGGGTGLLSLMIAQKNPELQIDAIELDEEAAIQAKENALASPWKNHINVILADARSFEFPSKYDIIVSNPPFYENELKGDNKKKNLAHHNEGLLLPELLSLIRKNLNPSGQFFLLLPYKRNLEIKDLILEHEFDISEMVFVRQSVKHDYFRIMLCGNLDKHESTETIIDELSIWDEKQQYTGEFVELLRDYYLYL